MVRMYDSILVVPLLSLIALAGCNAALPPQAGFAKESSAMTAVTDVPRDSGYVRLAVNYNKYAKDYIPPGNASYVLAPNILDRGTEVVDPPANNEAAEHYKNTLTLLTQEPTKVEASSNQPGGDSVELAKKLANPIADLISVPFQFNYDKGSGPKDAASLRLTIQPVIPITLNEEWNLITRTILPVAYQESPADGIQSNFGLGDTVQSFFFSPKRPANGWVWGVGPVFNWPTATDTALGSGQWGIGPTAIALKQENGWTYGILANHIWSFAGDDDRKKLNATFLQPFLAYTFPTATTITLNTESTYDWNDGQWTVPINLIFGQMVRFGKMPVNFQIGPRWYAESPNDGPEWGVRFQMTFLFPK